MVLFQTGMLQWGSSYLNPEHRDQSTWEVCTAVVCIYLLFILRLWSLTFLFISIKCIKLGRQMKLQAATTVFCGDFLWLKRGGFFCPSRSNFKLWFWSKMCCSEIWFGANISVHEKIWIPMQWCWSNLRCRSYPIVFLIFWKRDGEVGGISSLRARDLVCSGSDVKALD